MGLTEQQISYIKSLLYKELAKAPDMEESKLNLKTIRTLEEMEGAIYVE